MNKIKQLREAKNISMAEAARLLNIPYTTYIGYEKGDREPNSEMLIKIASFYNVSVDYLIGRQDFTTSNILPVLGNIAAGYEEIAMDDWSGETVEVPSSYLKGRKINDFIVLKAHGDSMYPEYHDGDKVVILKQNTLDRSGSVCAVLYNDEMATLKRVDLIDDKIKLTPLNHNYAPKTISGEEKEHFRIIGIPKILIREIED